jgi:four helix bundle protein
MEAKLFYKNLKVYQIAKILVKEVYLLMKKFPSEERYALCDQLRRAVISVPSNIVEGLSRSSDKEKHNFLNIAYGSLMETMCQLDISADLGYITEEELRTVELRAVELIRMLKGMMRNLNGNK